MGLDEIQAAQLTRMFREVLASMDAEVEHLQVIRKRLASIVIAVPTLDREEVEAVISELEKAE
jgi:hypothetical protein